MRGAFPGGSSGKEAACHTGDVRDTGSIPEWGWSPGGGHGNSLQYSYLENSMDRGAWQASVHGVAKSQIRLSNFHSLSVSSSISLGLAFDVFSVNKSSVQVCGSSIVNI